jgi:SAM-dependent methyltransferase
MESSPHKVVWAAGNLYEAYVGRWSRQVAREFLKWLSVPELKEWLDVGCGTGALSETILELALPASVSGVDTSEEFIDHARTTFESQSARFEVGEGEALPFESASFDVVVSGLALNFVPHPQQAVAEMVRVTRLGGVVAAYVWDYAGKMELIRYFWDVATELDPMALSFDEGGRFPVCQPTPLADLFREAGSRDVEVRSIDVPIPFRDFDDYWSPFLGGQGPAPGYAMSLLEEHREALREHLRARLPINRDGSILLMARAWAVRGVAP